MILCCVQRTAAVLEIPHIKLQCNAGFVSEALRRPKTQEDPCTMTSETSHEYGCWSWSAVTVRVPLLHNHYFTFAQSLSHCNNPMKRLRLTISVC